MGSSSLSLKSGINYNQDNSLISKENSSAIEEDIINMICVKSKFSKQEKEEKKNNVVYNNDKIPTMFEWSFKGTSVYLTGSFCNWNEFFLMQKDESGIYRLILDLNRGFHQYKFKIDNEWKYNKNFPIYNDNGNINNYIDTSNWEISDEYEKEEIDRSIFSISNMDFINRMKSNNINKHLNEEFYKAMINYGNYIPLYNEMDKIAPNFYYKIIMDCINENIKNNKNKENEIESKIHFLSIRFKKKYNNRHKRYNYENIYYNNDLNNMILYNNKLKHEQINHYHMKKIKCNSPLRSSIISRYRLKCINFIYYK
jgi:hypothetical protein